MALMVFIQNIHVFNCRSESNSAFSVPLKNNWLIVGGVIVSVLLHVIVMESTILSKFLQTVKVPFNHMIILFLVSTLVLAIIEVYKMVNNMYKEN